MSRVKRGTIANKRRRNVLKMVKGFRFGRKSKEAMANTAIRKAGQNAFRDRRSKKRTFRGLWNLKINAALRPLEMSYSKFIGALKKEKIEVDSRKKARSLHKNCPES